MAAAHPLPLDQSAELVGEWWIPGAPDDVASGRLTYQPYEPLRLEAVSGGQVLGTSDPIPLLHGLTVDGRFVTLRNLTIVNWSLNMPGGVLAQAHVGEAFVGMYARSEAELRLHRLEARIANLTAWLDPQGLAVAQRGVAEISSSGLVGLGRSPGGILATAWVDVETLAAPTRKPLRLELEQRGWVRFAARRRLPWEDLRSTLATFRQFLSLAAGADSSLLEVRGLATVTRGALGIGRRFRSQEPVWVLFQQRRAPEVPATAADEMLFRQADAAFDNHRPFTRWFRRAQQMAPIYDLYVAALPARTMFLENRFLAFVQALEAYDFRRHGKERRLREVIQGAVGDLPIGLRRHVPAKFPQLVRDTRHFLTHYNPKYEKNAAQGEQLFAATRAMKLLFELTMLLELGFSKRQVQALVEHNQRLVRDFQFGLQSA